MQELHREEEAGVVLPDVEHLHHVLVMQRGREPRLAEEHVDELAIAGEVRQHALQDQLAREALDPGQPRDEQLRHPALRE